MDAREKRANVREERANAREERAKARDLVADERDHAADQRNRIADVRERVADERDRIDASDRNDGMRETRATPVPIPSRGSRGDLASLRRLGALTVAGEATRLVSGELAPDPA